MRLRKPLLWIHLVTGLAAAIVLLLLGATGARYALRRNAAGGPLVSDNGNLIADSENNIAVDDPEGLSARLDAIPGVVGHGLFLGMTDLVLVGHDDGSVERINPR